MKLLATVPFSVAALFLVGCSGTTEQPPDTVGPVPVATVVDTLLPVVADTLPVDNTATIAPETLFGGEPCNALVAGDFSITFAGVAIGKLTGFTTLAEDACGYDVRAGGTDYVVIVQAETADDFDHPVTTAQAIDKFSDIGEEAIGVARGDDSYEVLVRVSNGYFSVTSPDKGSARALAAAAADRALRV